MKKKYGRKIISDEYRRVIITWVKGGENENKKYILTSSTLLAILGVLMEINLFEMMGLNFSTTEITLLLFVFTCLFF